MPWLREHFLGLVEQTLDSVDPDPARFVAALGRVVDGMRKGENPLADGGLMALVATDQQREVLDQVSGMMSLLEGHGDVTMDRAGAGFVPSADRFGRVLRQRRKQMSPIGRLIMQLVGLEAKLNQYEQGEKFIAAVEAAGGKEALEPVWERPENLPSIEEIRDPDLWLGRVQLAHAG